MPRLSYRYPDPPEFHALKIEISCSENANSTLKFSKIFALKHQNSALRKFKFCTRKLKWCSKQTAQNSALRKGKFCAQEMENSILIKWKFCIQKMESFPNGMKSWLFHDFLHQIQQFRTIPRCCAQVRNSELNFAITESWNPGGTHYL